MKKSKGIEPPPAPTIVRRPRHESAATAVASVASTPDAIQDECRPDSAGELANLVRGVRTARDDVVGAVLAGQLQSGFAPVDGDDSCSGQLAKELDRIEAQTADADHDRGAAGPDAGKRRLDRAVGCDACICQRRGQDRVEVADRDEKPRLGDQTVRRVSSVVADTGSADSLLGRGSGSSSPDRHM